MERSLRMSQSILGRHLTFRRFIEIGKHALDSDGKLPKECFARNASFVAEDLAVIIHECPKLLQGFLWSMMGLMHNGDLRTAQPIHVFPVLKISQALPYLQSRKNTRKTVIEGKKGFQLPVGPCAQPFFLLVTD